MYLLWPLYPSLPYRCKKDPGRGQPYRLILQNYPRVILSLAPSWACEFEDLSIGQLIAAIRKLGFSGVSETAIGAELVSSRVSDYLQQSQPGVYISSACPVVVEYIRKYSAEHTPAITPMLSPMLAHARILKDYYGNDLKVIFAGPCICKKLEADHFKELVEVAITFKDLKNWFEKENIHPEQLTPAAEDHFIPWRPESVLCTLSKEHASGYRR